MAEAAKRYAAARRRRSAAFLGMILSWVAMVGLILLGVRFMDRFSLFMIASLIVGAVGTVSWLVLNYRCMGCEGELAMEISWLPLPLEELLRLAGEYKVDQTLVFFFLAQRTRDVSRETPPG